ncbi:MAG TPA: hypothetical protein PKC09_05590, partial [Paracoccus sp. (in: a-proteobacteria)]|nr:hypothetical protein [Paracoccus sp. (in: a-proteobacteria)]HMR37627.1 hypothetical protein [Paracoccus sp. (in: a-proteobacteria)]
VLVDHADGVGVARGADEGEGAALGTTTPAGVEAINLVISEFSRSVRHILNTDDSTDISRNKPRLADRMAHLSRPLSEMIRIF